MAKRGIDDDGLDIDDGNRPWKRPRLFACDDCTCHCGAVCACRRFIYDSNDDDVSAAFVRALASATTAADVPPSRDSLPLPPSVWSGANWSADLDLDLLMATCNEPETTVSSPSPIAVSDSTPSFALVKLMLTPPRAVTATLWTVGLAWLRFLHTGVLCALKLVSVGSGGGGGGRGARGVMKYTADACPPASLPAVRELEWIVHDGGGGDGARDQFGGSSRKSRSLVCIMARVLLYFMQQTSSDDDVVGTSRTTLAQRLGIRFNRISTAAVVLKGCKVLTLADSCGHVSVREELLVLNRQWSTATVHEMVTAAA